MRTARTLIHIVTKAEAGEFDREALPPHQAHHLAQAAVTGWKSPVPYLFGGLAAMLGLIAFALLILACSYWKLSGYLESGENLGDEVGEDDKVAAEKAAAAAIYPNSILVIMAGEAKPTFLATPATSRTTSFGDTCSCSSSGGSGSSSDSSGGDKDKGDKMVELRTTTTTIISPSEELTMTTTTTTTEEEKR